MTKWNDYYKPWTAADYKQHMRAWQSWCNIVAESTPKRGRIVEVGFGTGQMSIYLSSKKYLVTGIDQNEVQVKRAMNLTRDVNKVMNLKAKPIFDWCDFFEFKNLHPFKFDTVFSQGLLEHFSDKDIQKIIARSFALGNVVAFSVPLDKFGHTSRGDERLLPKGHWRNLVSKYKVLHWSTFAGDKQLAAVIK